MKCMAVIEINRTSDLDRPIAVDVLPGVGFTSEQLAHKFVISATKSGSAVTLSGGVVARVLRADDAMVLVQGTISGGKATITLSKDCYKIPGQISIAIMVSETSTVTTCVYAAVAQIRRSDSDSIVDNDRVIPSIDEILAQLSVMEAATNAANTAADAANTAASNANSKATAANTAASTANTAASNADAKAALANTAAGTANTAASNADSKAALANTAAGAANTAAANADEKAAAAETATTAANNAAASATTAAGNADTATARANAAAETIEDMTVAGTRVAPTAPAAAAISTVDGHYHIDFSIPQGVTGAGAAIASQVTEYQNSTSGTTVPTGSWLPEQPNTPQGQFLWARRTITWNSGDTTVLYSVSRMGIDGSGSVVSVNGQAPDAQGDVSLLGSDMAVSGTDSRTVAAAIAANATAISDLGTATQQAIDDLDAATVKSVNSATPDSQGDVTLTGADLNVSGTDTRSIDTVVSDIDTALDSINTALGQKANSASLAAVATSGKYSDLSGTPGTASTSANGLMSAGDKTVVERIKNINSNVAIMANGNTAPSAIAAGQYVIWSGSLYTARSAISSGATLSTSNLAAVSHGGLNNLKASVDSLNSKITPETVTVINGVCYLSVIGNICMLNIGGAISQAPTGSETTIATLGTNYRPAQTTYGVVVVEGGRSNKYALITINNRGEIILYNYTGASANYLYGSIMFVR